MNVELLEKVKKRILKAPKRLNMKYWGISTFVKGLDQVLEEPPCHTQACLAGETLLAARKAVIDRKYGGIKIKVGSQSYEDNARNLLDITTDEANRLFQFKSWWEERANEHKGWPTKFEHDYNAAKTSLERAKVAAARIDHFIATNGAE